jgi:hypothetical protein
MQHGTDSLDRQLILDAVAKYAWGYDEGDFEMLADSFTENATSGGTIANSETGWGPVVGRIKIVETLKAIRESQTDQRRHTLHTHRFTAQTAATAQLSLYMACLATRNGETRLVTVGKYAVDAIKEPDGVWRMSRLDAVLDSPF